MAVIFGKKDVDQGGVYTPKEPVSGENRFWIKLTFGYRLNNSKNSYYLRLANDNYKFFEFGKNGRTNEDYVLVFDIFGDREGPQALKYLSVDVECSPALMQAGFSCKIDEYGRLVFSGRLSTPFDESVVFEVYDPEITKPFTFLKRLTIVANNTESLWKKKESPKDGPYPQLIDDLSEGAKVDFEDLTLTAIVASKRGRMHEHVGTPRDDNYCMRLSKKNSDWHFFAIADGAGSARYSRKGSEIACKAVVDEMERLFNENSASMRYSDVSDEREIRRNVALAIQGAYNAIREEAIRMKQEDDRVALRDYHTTLLCGALKRFTANELPGAKPMWALVSYWVGDGALALYGVDGPESVILLGESDGGEYAGETRFLTMPTEVEPEKIDSRIRVTFFNDFKALVLATDGVTDPLFPSDNALRSPKHWNIFWNEKLPEKIGSGAFDKQRTTQKRAQALLEGMNFFERGYHDDRTLLILTPEPRNESADPGSGIKQAENEPRVETHLVTPQNICSVSVDGAMNASVPEYKQGLTPWERFASVNGLESGNVYAESKYKYKDDEQDC